jgi:hypothetical protein
MKPKKLSLHVNREVEASPVPSLDRPIVHPLAEVRDPASGLYEMIARDSQGNRIGFLQISAPDMDNELVDALRDWQARHAHELPIPKLVVQS